MSVNEKMTAIANAIRERTGGTDKLSLDEMAAAINGLTDVITSAEQLIALMGNPSKWGKAFIVTEDISLEGYENQSPIGSTDVPFTGSFDGGGHTISGINITASGCAGLFGYVSGGVIQNLIIEGSVTSVRAFDENGNSIGTGSSAAGLVAHSSGITILNCVNRVNVTGTYRVAGIIGSCDIEKERTTYVENCSNEGAITSSCRRAGGIVGRIYGIGMGYCSFINCKNVGNVVSGCETGGFVGRFEVTTAAANSKYTIEKFANYGNIESTFDNADPVFTAGEETPNCAGGLAGLFSSGGSGVDTEGIKITFDTIYNEGSIKAQDKYVGGLFGFFRSYDDYATSVSNAMNAGSVYTAATVAGGIFGTSNHGKHIYTVENLYNCGSVKSEINEHVSPITASWGDETLFVEGTIQNVYYLDFGEAYTELREMTAVTTSDYSTPDTFIGIGTSDKWAVTKIGPKLTAFYPLVLNYEGTNLTEEIVNNLEQAYKNGYDKGLVFGKHGCVTRHYTEIKRGDGTNVFSANCGFEPDYFAVFSFAGYPLSLGNTVQCLVYDRRSMGQYASYRLTTNESAAQSSSRISNVASAKQFTYADGVMKYDGSVSTVASSLVFDANTDYIVVCVKYTDESDAEIITREVNALPDTGGTVTFSQIKVNGAFTDDEWAELIATKPTWTFNLV